MEGAPQGSTRAQRRWEKRVVRRTLRGDSEAFGALYEAFADPLMRRILLPRLGDLTAAEDALSETFQSALTNLEGYRDQGAGIWPWLARIAANKATDMHRRAGRTGRALADVRALLPPNLAPSADPEGALLAAREERSLGARIAETLESLNPRYRRAIELRLVEERAREDCAALLDVKVGTFDVLLLRALRAFRTTWERQELRRNPGGST